jgi:chromosome segregation ATPase
MKPVTVLIEKVDKIEKSITTLGANLAATDSVGSKLGIDLKALQTIVESNDVQKLQGSIATMRTQVEQLQAVTRDLQLNSQAVAKETLAAIQAATKEVQTVRERIVGVESQMGVLKKDVDSQWNAIDSIGAGALKGR